MHELWKILTFLQMRIVESNWTLFSNRIFFYKKNIAIFAMLNPLIFRDVDLPPSVYLVPRIALFYEHILFTGMKGWLFVAVSFDIIFVKMTTRLTVIGERNRSRFVANKYARSHLLMFRRSLSIVKLVS